MRHLFQSYRVVVCAFVVTLMLGVPAKAHELTGIWSVTDQPGTELLVEVQGKTVYVVLTGFGEDGGSTWLAGYAQRQDTGGDAKQSSDTEVYSGALSRFVSLSGAVSGSEVGEIHLTYTGDTLTTAYNTEALQGSPVDAQCARSLAPHGGEDGTRTVDPRRLQGFWWQEDASGTGIFFEAAEDTLAARYLSYAADGAPQVWALTTALPELAAESATGLWKETTSALYPGTFARGLGQAAFEGSVSAYLGVGASQLTLARFLFAEAEAPRLGSLHVENGSISPGFNPAITRYGLRRVGLADNATESPEALTLTCAPLEPTLSLSVDGYAYPPGASYTLGNTASGQETVIRVSDPDGTTHRDYTLVFLPEDFPEITANVPGTPLTTGAAKGSIYLTNFNISGESAYAMHIMELDAYGVPLFFRQAPEGSMAVADYKQQENGIRTYMAGTLDNAPVYLLNENHEQISVYTDQTVSQTNPTGATNIDIHEFLITEEGTYLYLLAAIRDKDMTPYGGVANARYWDFLIREVDPETDEILFEWDSADHLSLADAHETVVLTVEPPDAVDPFHPNSIAVDHDGNLLVSSRHMNEVTKIDRETGAIIWRLGGNFSDFTFVNDPLGGFSYQHDARRLESGHLLLFDNGNTHAEPQTRILEYALNEETMEATLVWAYQHPTAEFSFAMGSCQRLANGNTFIGWGATQGPVATEVTPDGTIVHELTMGDDEVSYRARKQ